MDFNSLDLDGSSIGVGLVPNGVGQVAAVGAAFSTDWLFTLRGRLGVTVSPRVLAYATGGLAVSEVKVANAFADDLGVLFADPSLSNSGASSRSEVKAGWTIGGGVEWALDRNWTIKGEYLYVDLGSVSTTAKVISPIGVGVSTPNTLSTSAEVTSHIARAGINYKF